MYIVLLTILYDYVREYTSNKMYVYLFYITQ